jgi:hypothetical protein
VRWNFALLLWADLCCWMLAGIEVGPCWKGLGLRCDTLSSRYNPNSRQ